MTEFDSNNIEHKIEETLAQSDDQGAGGKSLIKAFDNITDKAKRRKFLELAKTLP